jgi:acyl dehydratase
MIDYTALKNRRFPEVGQDYAPTDAILYALGVGLSADGNERELPFVYEDQLKVIPTFATTLADCGFWMQEPATGITWQRVLHREQELIIHEPLPEAGSVVGRTVIRDIYDRGPDRGALFDIERRIDFADGRPLATLRFGILASADGGFGGSAEPPSLLPDRPGGEPGRIIERRTYPNSALIYRLCGDFNPLHIDPRVAHAAGFARPILHGLCTFGMAAAALILGALDGDTARLSRLRARFSAPVFPGETLRFSLWLGGPHAHFEARTAEDGRLVLGHGFAEFRPS